MNFLIGTWLTSALLANLLLIALGMRLAYRSALDLIAFYRIPAVYPIPASWQPPTPSEQWIADTFPSLAPRAERSR